MEEFYIKQLCRQIEKRFAHALDTTEDFAALSDAIWGITGERLSVSTLKRCFGRVNAKLVHRNTTLSILARYVGCDDWADYTRSLRASISEESEFKPINAISISDMTVGCELKINWLPNREILVRHLGQSRFVILEEKNTKLLSDDMIEIALLAPGEPMFISRIVRGAKTMTGYLAGQLHGVNVELRVATDKD